MPGDNFAMEVAPKLMPEFRHKLTVLSGVGNFMLHT